MASAKGTAVVQLVKALHAFDAKARRALHPSLHHYLDERILLNKWYPEEDYLSLITALTQILPMRPGQDPWEQFGKLAAQHDLSTVYKGMVRGGTLISTLRMTRDLFRLYHDTGRFEISGDEERACFEVYEYASVSVGHCRFISSFIREHLRMAMGREYTIDETLCRGRLDSHCRRDIF